MLNEWPVEPESKAAGHEVPYLGAADERPVGGVADDAGALRAVITAQAQDLRRLRRALVAASATADERLEILRSLTAAGPFEAPAPKAPSQTPDRYPMQVGTIMPDATPEAIAQEVLRVQEHVAEIVERSRWRQLGQRIGAAKRLAWEQGDWRTQLVGRDGTPLRPLGSVPN